MLECECPCVSARVCMYVYECWHACTIPMHQGGGSATSNRGITGRMRLPNAESCVTKNALDTPCAYCKKQQTQNVQQTLTQDRRNKTEKKPTVFNLQQKLQAGRKKSSNISNTREQLRLTLVHQSQHHHEHPYQKHRTALRKMCVKRIHKLQSSRLLFATMKKRNTTMPIAKLSNTRNMQWVVVS